MAVECGKEGVDGAEGFSREKTFPQGASRTEIKNDIKTTRKHGEK
jgi:hypothetical protein